MLTNFLVSCIINAMMKDKPTYNIGVVARLTGIPVATLRAWERRYGFPDLQRSAGGQRLYSDEDVNALRWVKARVDSGMQARLAVAASRQRLVSPAAPAPLSPSISAPAMDVLQRDLLSALAEPDLRRADQLLGESLLVFTPETLATAVIAPLLDEIGSAWQSGKMSVASEHLASAHLRHHLLLWMMTSPAPRAAPAIILACPPGEWHEGGLLILGVLLRRQGIPVSYLGQNVPFADLAIFTQRIQPAGIVLSASQRETALTLADWTRSIAQQEGKPWVAFGGHAFIAHPELQTATPGIYLGDRLHESAARLLELHRGQP